MHLGLVKSRHTEDFYVKTYDWLEFGYFYGVEEALRQQGFSVQVLSEDGLNPETLKAFSAIVLPEANCLADDAIKNLVEYVLNGGKALTVGRVGQRREEGKVREGLSELEELLGIESRMGMAMEAPYWPWWDCRFTLRLTEAGARVFRAPEQPIFVYMDHHAPGFSDEVDALADLLIDKNRFKGVCTRKAGKGRVLSIVPPLGQIIYHYLKDHRYAFYGSLYQTDMSRRFFYPVDGARDPREGIELSCAYLCEMLCDAVKFLLGEEGPCVKKWRYPDGVDALVVATHDYDAFGDEQVKVYENLQRIHRKHGIRSTHYFMADVYPLDLEDARRIFSELRQRGDEIGLHTTRHREPYSLEHMRDELERLKGIVGDVVDGESLHGSLDLPDSYRKAPTAELPVLAAEVGLEYARDVRDSRSIVPASDGAATCFPYVYPKAEGDGRIKALGLFNIPMMFTDAHHIRIGLSKEEILKSMVARLDATLRHNGVFCFVAHPHYNRLPDEKYSDIYEAFIEYAEKKRVRWWTALQASRWEKIFSQISVDSLSWDGKTLRFSVRGPEEAFLYGKVTLQVCRWLDAEKATVNGEPCTVERGDGFVKITIHKYGLVALWAKKPA